jgi:hypothetical protein
VAARLTPGESRAIGRAAGYLIRMLIHMGMWWTLLIVGACTGFTYAIYTLPRWWRVVEDGWDAVMDWMER